MILVSLAGVLLLVHPAQRALGRLGVPWRSLALVCVLAPTFVASLLVSSLYARFTQGLFVTLAAIGTGGFLLGAYAPHPLRGLNSGTAPAGRYAKWCPRLAMAGVFAVFFGPTTQFPDVWDRVGEEGSFAMQNAILFRAFPPPDFSVPGKPLIYHYGYDAAVSAFALITRFPLDAASNAVSLLALIWLMVLARQLAGPTSYCHPACCGGRGRMCVELLLLLHTRPRQLQEPAAPCGLLEPCNPADADQ